MSCLMCALWSPVPRAWRGVRACVQGPKTLSYNPAENCLLITSDVDGGSYELYQIPKEAARGDTAPVGGLGLADAWQQQRGPARFGHLES